MYLRIACLMALLALGGAACVKKQGTIDAQGYTNHLYEYRVRADGSGELMSDAWLLDNYYGEKVKYKPDHLKAKRTGDYLVEYELDANGDGKADKTKEELRYDLRFEHRHNGGVIWLRTVPVSTTLEQTELRVLVREFVDGLGGPSYTSVSLGKGSVLVESERLTTRIIDAQSTAVGGAEAYEAIVEIANVDQLKLDPNARRKLAKLIVVRTRFRYGNKRANWPVLMVAGYANFPEDFEGSLEDFHSLLGRIELLGLAKYEPKAQLVVSPPEPPTAASPPETPSAGEPPPSEPPTTEPQVPPAGGTEPPSQEEPSSGAEKKGTGPADATAPE